MAEHNEEAQEVAAVAEAGKDLVLNLGGGNPWDDKAEMVKTAPVAITSARDKMPFEVTPFFPRLSRYGGNIAPAALKFVCLFIIREGALLSNEVENLLVVRVVVDVSSNQLSISYHAAYIWPALEKKIPLAFNFVVHFYLSPLGLYSHLGEKFIEHFKAHCFRPWSTASFNIFYGFLTNSQFLAQRFIIPISCLF